MYNGTNRVQYKRQNCSLDFLFRKEGTNKCKRALLPAEQTSSLSCANQTRKNVCIIVQPTRVGKKKDKKRSWDKMQGQRTSRIYTKQELGGIKYQSHREFQKRNTLPRANEISLSPGVRCQSQDIVNAEGLLEKNITQRLSKTQTYVQPVNYTTA